MQITPRGKQKEVVALPTQGHFVVLGTAGSGKTTIALLRALHLSAIPFGGKVLLVTFNGALVKFMEKMADSTSSNLVVENYHKFARGYLNSRGKMPRWNGIFSNDEKAELIRTAILIILKANPNEATLKRSNEFFVDEITFIEKYGFSNLIEYQKAERIGRAAANLKRENRKWVYEVYLAYQKLRDERGNKFDWDDIAAYTYRELLKDTSPRRYQHIIVDEGQDFSPMMIKSLVAAVPPDGSFTFFGDVAQQIYGSRLSWRDSGIDATRIWRFNVNYRNTAEISAFAKSITQNPNWQFDQDMVETVEPIAKGQKPVLIRFSCASREIDWTVNQACYLAKTSSVAIILRNRSSIDSYLYALKRHGCTAIEINKDTPGFADRKEVYLSTYHAAKGLEFEYVFIPSLNEEVFPDPTVVSDAISPKEAYADEIKLLYVAATRSRFGLYMSYSGTLSPLFPTNSDTYDKAEEEQLK